MRQLEAHVGKEVRVLGELDDIARARGPARARMEHDRREWIALIFDPGVMAATGLDAWRGEFVVVTGVPERTTHPRTGAPLLQIVVKHPGQLRLSAVPGLPAPPSRPP